MNRAPQNDRPGNDFSPDNHVKIQSADDALFFLFEELRKANLLFATGTDAGLIGVIAALNAVVQFLLFFEDSIDHRQPLIALLNALVSLDGGEVLPLLEPRRRSGQSPASAVRENVTAMAAVTVHRLCETGLGRKEARELVARAFRKAGVKAARGRNPQVTARTVRGWCEKIAEDVGRHSEAAKAFDRQRQSQTPEAQAIAQAIESKGAEATRNALLEGLRLSLTQMRARLSIKKPS
jgi:hypothetical protein